MVRTLLIDDEPKALKVLENKLLEYCPDLQIIGTTDSAQSAYELIINKQPQLVFLDIAMPQESGFDLLQRLPTINFEIIFVTGFDDYAIQAIQFCAIGYVVKPIENMDLVKAVEHASKRIQTKTENNFNKQLLQNLSRPLDPNNRIGIPTMEGVEFVRVKDIIRCEAMERCTQLFLVNEKRIVSSQNLGHFKKMLINYDFYQTHRSHLIHLMFIERYSKEGVITMNDESKVPLSRRNKDGLLAKFR